MIEENSYNVSRPFVTEEKYEEYRKSIEALNAGENWDLDSDTSQTDSLSSGGGSLSTVDSASWRRSTFQTIKNLHNEGVPSAYAQRSFFQTFKDKALELEYMDFIYGRKYNILVCILDFIIASSFALCVFVDKRLMAKIVSGIVNWSYLALSLMFIWRFTMRRKILIEGMMMYCQIITIVLNTLCTYYFEIPMKQKVFHPFYSNIWVMFLSSVLIRARVVVQFATFTVAVVLVSIESIILSLLVKQSDCGMIVTIICNFIFICLVLFSFSYLVEKTTRAQFISRMIIKENENLIVEENNICILLLMNIFPMRFIQTIQKFGDKEICKIFTFKKGAVLFLDLCDFTKYSVSNDSQTIITFLNTLFGRYDGFIRYLELEKVYTVGDGYFVSSFGDSFSLNNIILFGLCCLKYKKVKSFLKDWNYKIRIGVSTGMFYMVVYGRRTRHLNFDLFGEVVDKAIELESTCKPNSVRVDKAIYMDTKDVFKYSGNHEEGEYNVDLRTKYNIIKDGVSENKKVRELFKRATMSLRRKKVSVRVYNDLGTVLKVVDRTNSSASVFSSLLESTEERESPGIIKSFSDFLRSFLALKSEKIFVYHLSKNSKNHYFVITSQLFFGLFMLLHFLCTFNIELMYNNVFVICMYLTVFVDLILCISLLSMNYFCSLKYEKWIKIYFIGVTIVPALFCFSHVFSMSLLPFDVGLPLYIYTVAFSFLTICSIVYLHFIIKFIFILISIVLSLSLFYFHFNDLFDEDKLYNILLIWFVVFGILLLSFGVFDYYRRMEFADFIMLERKRDHLNKEKMKNEKLVLSVLPPFCLKKFLELEKMTSLRKMKELNIVYDTLWGCVGVVTLSNVEKSFKMDFDKSIKFISNILSVFCKISDENNCIWIKNFRYSMLFMTIQEEEDFEKKQEIVTNCVMCLKDCLETLQNKSSNRNIVFKGGCFYGKVSGGLIGSLKFRYDLIGNSVNMPSRLCQTAYDNTIQTTKEVVSLYDDFPDSRFSFKKRGKVFLKGKGDEEVFFIE